MDGRLVLGLVLACGCSAHLNDGTGQSDAAPHGDARPDTRAIDGVPDAYVFGPWGAPTTVTGAADPAQNIDDETLDSTMTELYFGIVDPALTGSPKQLWMMTRATAADPWGTPTRMDATFNVVAATPPTEESPRLSPDDKTLYFGRGGDIYFSTRSAVGQPWSPPLQLATVSTANYEKWFAVCAGGYYLVARNTGAGTAFHLYQGQLGGSDALATELAGTTGSETGTFLTSDCTTTYFASGRSGTTQLYTAMRSAPGATWSAPSVLTAEFGTSTDNEDPWLSPDARTFYFATTRFGGTNTNKAVYCSTR
jgi:hypothetical protein